MKNLFRFKFILFCLLLGEGMATAQTVTKVDMVVTGTRDKRINMVFMPDGYKADQMGLFATHVQAAVDYLFTREPWIRYKSYFNVYRIEVPSAESGTTYSYDIKYDGVITVPKQVRNTYLDTGFRTSTSTNLLTLSNAGSGNATKLLNKNLPEYDIPIVLVNDDRYGGSGGPIAVASVNEYSIEILEHELGHSFANLTDEYDFDIPGYPATEQLNATTKTQRSQIRWNMWIENETLIPTAEYGAYTDVVGLFEGAHYRTRGWYRPHDNALMRTLTQPPGAVAREALVLACYRKIFPLESYSPTVMTHTFNQPATVGPFSVTVTQPSTLPSLEVTWKVDGVAVATGLTFQKNSTEIGFDGKHTLTAEVRDPTDWVRRDPTGLMKKTVNWTINLDNQGIIPTIVSTPDDVLTEVGKPITLTMDARGPVAGQVQFQWHKNGKAIANAKSSVLSIPSATLADGGVYFVRVTGGDYTNDFYADVVVMDDRIQNVILQHGKPGALNMAATGPIMAGGYEWSYENTVILPNTGFTGLGTTKLSITSVNLNAHRGTYSVKLTTSAGLTKTYDTHELNVFNQKPQLTLASNTLPAGQIGAAYGPGGAGKSIVVEPVFGASAATFVASGLPPGLKVDTKTGLINGVPIAYKKDKFGDPAPYAVTLTGSNGLGSAKITVNLVVYPLPVKALGSFVAPIGRSAPLVGLNGGLGGRLDLATTLNGSYTGKVILGGLTYSFKGVLTSTVGSEVVVGNVRIPRSGNPAPAPIDLSFSIDGPLEKLSGTIGLMGDTPLAFTGWFNPWSKTVTANAFDGYHTFRLDLPPPEDPEEPEYPFPYFPEDPTPPTGRGFGSFTIGLDGKTTIIGKTADGESFTSACFLGSNGQLMIFSLQKGKPQGSVVGSFRVDKSSNPTDDVDNVIIGDPDVLTWWKPQSTDSTTRIYKEGIEVVGLTVVGARYVDPGSTNVVFGISPATSGVPNAELNFTGASIEGVERVPDTMVQIQAKSTVKIDPVPTAGTSLVINQKLGTFTGKFNLLDPVPFEDPSVKVSRPVTFQGIIILDNSSSPVGDGFFLLPDLPSYWLGDTPTTSPIQSGRVTLLPR